ncbi:MAG: phospholipase, partial [Aquihabitans sp.]
MTGERARTDPECWFLSADERGNPGTIIDRRRNGGVGWTAGNEVVVHVDGASYFTRLNQALHGVAPRDHVWFTDWAGNADEQLSGAGTELSKVLCALADRGAAVRGLLWRSHPKEAGFDQEDNLFLAAELNDHGASLALDQRVRRGGSHHQKMVVISRFDPITETVGSATKELIADLAFAGGIDLCHGRRDDRDHLGDSQPTDELDDVYGARPAWHDVQVEVRGPAAGDLAWTFHERWHDPQPLDKPTPL